MSSAVLFIDGSNFYHSLKESQQLPFDVDKFQQLFELLSLEYDLKKIYYYDAIKNSDIDNLGYAKQQRFHERLKKCYDNVVIKTRKLKYLLNITDKQIINSANKVGIIDSCKNKL